MVHVRNLHIMRSLCCWDTTVFV